MKPGAIVVLILNWRRAADTVACVRSLQALGRDDLHPVVIDNGSGDGSEDVIRAAFPDLDLIQTGANLGYAGGNNVGLRLALQSPARYVMLLNNDTELREDLFAPLLRVAQAADDRVALGSMTYSSDAAGALQFGGVVWTRSDSRFRASGESEVRQIAGETVTYTDYIQGSALFIPVAVLRRVGLLDERFFLTYEETDWCFRARRAGFDLWMVPNSRVWHGLSPSFGGRASPMYEYFMSRNELLWLEKVLGRRAALRQYGKPLYWQLRRRMSRKGFPENGTSGGLADPVNRAFIQGYWDYLTRRFGDCPDWIRRARKPARLPAT